MFVPWASRRGVLLAVCSFLAAFAFILYYYRSPYAVFPVKVSVDPEFQLHEIHGCGSDSHAGHEDILRSVDVKYAALAEDTFTFAASPKPSSSSNRY